MYDIVTIGSATRDVFVKSKGVKVLPSKAFKTGKGVSFSLGSKLDIDELHFEIGGGAINTAVTFASQGLSVAALSVVGKDSGGNQILASLQKSGVDTQYVFVDEHGSTAYSFIFSTSAKDRTILQYKGVSWHLGEFQIPWSEIFQTKWIYLNHIGEESTGVLKNIFEAIEEKDIQVAWNPGRTQLEHAKEQIFPYLQYVTVCIVNQEEASEITKIPYQKEKEIFKKLDALIPGIVIMTKGSKGVSVSDGKSIWRAPAFPVKNIVDATGAGDAFGSGFVASLIHTPGNIEAAMQLAMANCSGVLTQWGATKGLLEKGESPMKWGKLSITKKIL